MILHRGSGHQIFMKFLPVECYLLLFFTLKLFWQGKDVDGIVAAH